MLFAVAAPAQQTGVVRLPWDQWQMHLGNDAQCFQIRSACLHRSPRARWRVGRARQLATD
jgi:hypothetical protein